MRFKNLYFFLTCVTAEYDDQWYGTDDLSLFFQRNSLPNNTGIVQLIGYNDPTSDGGEADLDIRKSPASAIALSIASFLFHYYNRNGNALSLCQLCFNLLWEIPDSMPLSFFL